MGFVCKQEAFISALMDVTVTTMECYVNGGTYARYFTIERDGNKLYESPRFFGGDYQDVKRNCDNAIVIVRAMLEDTGFLKSKVVDKES
jgi:hypothetical protein